MYGSQIKQGKQTGLCCKPESCLQHASHCACQIALADWNSSPSGSSLPPSYSSWERQNWCVLLKADSSHCNKDSSCSLSLTLSAGWKWRWTSGFRQNFRGLHGGGEGKLQHPSFYQPIANAAVFYHRRNPAHDARSGVQNQFILVFATVLKQK